MFNNDNTVASQHQPRQLGGRFYLASCDSTAGYLDINVCFDAGTAADAEPDRIIGKTRGSDAFAFVIERRGRGYVRLLTREDGIQREDGTAGHAYDLLHDIIGDEPWVKRGPFLVKDRE